MTSGKPATCDATDSPVPVDSIEQALEALCLLRVQLRCPGNATLQVLPPVSDAVPVFAVGALSHAAVKDSLQPIELFAAQVGPLVHHHVANGLAAAGWL